MDGIKMNLLMIFGASLIIVMQLGLGQSIPLSPKTNDTVAKATVAPRYGEAVTKYNTTTTIITTLKPTTNSTTKMETQTTKGTTVATVKATGFPRKQGMNRSPHPMWRKHHKRRCHVAAEGKNAPVAATSAPNPYFYNNLLPPMLEEMPQELNYGMPPELLPPVLTDELLGITSAPLKHHRKNKAATTMSPLLSMLQPSHREESPFMELLDGVMELISGNNDFKDGKEPKQYGYFNKMVSPDGKYETEEFGLLSPNMMIQGMQHEQNYELPSEHNYGLPSEVLPSEYNYGLPSEVLPPEHTFGMPSDIMQPEFKPLKKPKKSHRKKLAYNDFPDDGIDLALRKNYELIDRLLGDLEQEDDLLRMVKDATMELKKAKKDSLQIKSLEPKEELIVSCPIHHEQHLNRNGKMIEEDIVDVNQCEAVKIQD